MDVLEMISEDHEKVRQLLEKMTQTGERATKTQSEQFGKLMALVQAHSKAEEEVLYPLLLEAEDAREHMLEALEEHHLAEVMLRELQDSLDHPDHERWTAKLSVFRTILEYHIDEEEGETFDYAQDLLSEEQLQDLGETFTSQKRSLEESLSGKMGARS